jgi:hypothetical protein
MTIFTDFYDAGQARNIATGGASALGEVLTEINYIKAQIDQAATASGLSVTIAGSTPMTSTSSYFFAWNDVAAYTDDTSVLNRSRMDSVVRYFSALGYRMRRERVGTTNYFQWVITW